MATQSQRFVVQKRPYREADQWYWIVVDTLTGLAKARRFRTEQSAEAEADRANGKTPFYSPDYRNGLDKLRRFGLARDRVADREPRRVILTDDEAVAILDVLTQHAPAGAFGQEATQ